MISNEERRAALTEKLKAYWSNRKQSERKSMPRKAKQEPLLPDPGKIEELQAKALEYASARDARMVEGKEEIRLKGELLDLMKKHNKKVYHAEGLEIELIPVGEKLKVTVAKASEEEDAA
jgi:hypothetical protein